MLWKIIVIKQNRLLGIHLQNIEGLGQKDSMAYGL